MENKIRCQSCGMPLSAEFNNYGTLADGKFHQEFCIFCFKDGDFTNPNQTLDEMIKSAIENMTNEIGFPIEKAAELANSFIPTLKRWQ